MKKIIIPIVAIIAVIIIAVAVFFAVNAVNNEADNVNQNASNIENVSNMNANSNDNLMMNENTNNETNNNINGIQPNKNTSTNKNDNGTYSETTENISNEDIDVGGIVNTEYVEKSVTSQVFNNNAVSTDMFVSLDEIPKQYDGYGNRVISFSQGFGIDDFYSTVTFKNPKISNLQKISDDGTYKRYSMTVKVKETNRNTGQTQYEELPDRTATYDVSIVYNNAGKIVYLKLDDVTTK